MRAQSSFEYIGVFGVMLIMIVPLTYLYYSNTVRATQDVQAARITEIGLEIVSEARDISYAIGQAKRTVEMKLPPDVINISTENQTLVFTMANGKTFVTISEVPINASIDHDYIYEGNLVLEKRLGSSTVILCMRNHCP